MRKRKWETTVCFICDYWWAILLLLVLLTAGLLTSRYWLPVLGINPDLPSPEIGNLPKNNGGESGAAQPPYPTSQVVPTLATQWIDYHDSQWNYSISYPSQLDDQKVVLLNIHETHPDNLEDALLFANSQSAVLQDHGEGETLRAVITKTNSSPNTFDQWAATMVLGRIDQLQNKTYGNCNGSEGSQNNPNGSYVNAKLLDLGTGYISVVVSGSADQDTIRKIIQSFLPDQCKP